MRKFTQLKIWPEISQQYPAIIPYERLLSTKQSIIEMDFTSISKVDSSGLTILLLNLIKVVGDLKNRKWDITYPANEELGRLIRELNFYKLLFHRVPNENLFLQEENSHILSQKYITFSFKGTIVKTYPVYQLEFLNNDNPRTIVDEFKAYLINQLFYLQENYDFELSVFIQILVEMAKNSADHTNDNAYFGLDIKEDDYKIRVQFTFGDLGIGINNSIRKFIKKDPTFNDKAGHLALSDAYHYALQIGNTTKINTLNKGIGMASIFNLSKQMNIDLSVYDAESRAFLSSALNITHTELRKVFYTVGFKVGFYYYGEVEINK